VTGAEALEERSAEPAGHSPLERPVKPHWWVTLDGDLDCHDLYVRHYSANRYADGRRERDKRFAGPGNKLVLRTERGDAMFVWRRFVDDCIDQRTGQRQDGINCAVFRNESVHLSSELIRQADAIADAIWTDRRHYTYVNADKVASSNPGYCFLRAGWTRCGVTKGGLLVLERVRLNVGGEATATARDTI
jgi:hypothetical protein